MYNRAALIILDGWGLGKIPQADAIFQANTPFMDKLTKEYPQSQLITFGEDVGLPEGQMGNSEVGHLNIGAGRVVYQELARINKAIREQELSRNPNLVEAFLYAKKHQKPLHLLGLVSDGGVHSHIQHLMAICDIAVEAGIPEIFIHAFTDGRDTDPKSGIVFLETLEKHIQKYSNVKIASICGRYYAMDRDKRWERVKLAYDLLVAGEGEPFAKPLEAIEKSYSQGITDEFIKPMVRVNEAGKPLAVIQKDDLVFCFNFRTDRCREITSVLTQKDMPEYNMAILPLYYITMTRYDETFKNVKVVFETIDITKTLGEVLSEAGKTQIRIAETEKYPHVTFFFSGGREAVFEGEKRIIIPSPKVATYDLQPEMSANEITESIITEINENQPDFICLNYANTDMVGHTGVFTAAMKAAETVDNCMQRLVSTLLQHEYACIIIADHGNSDYMINPDWSPNTAHTTNPVPCWVLSPDKAIRSVQNGRLADIAPSILKLLAIEPPKEMTGKALF